MTGDPTLFALDASAPTVGASCAACGRPGRHVDDHCPSCTAAGVRALRFELEVARAHHPDCDEYRMHSATRINEGGTLYHFECQLPECAWREPAIGCYSSGPTGSNRKAAHNGADPCIGQCHAWFSEDAP